MKTILFGAFGRHNFGDMLFPHIMEKVIRSRYPNIDIEFCDLLSTNMSFAGGHDVKSITEFFDCNHELNLIVVGGEVGSCSMHHGLKMFSPSDKHREEIDKLTSKYLPLAYLIEKDKFKRPNVFLCNAIGNFSEHTSNIIKNYEYTSFRDQRSYEWYIQNHADQFHAIFHVPDCVILLKHFFNSKIQSRIKISNKLIAMAKRIGSRYIAVQFKPSQLGDCVETLKMQFTKLIDELDIPIVFFCAGTAYGHDSVEVYKNLFSGSLPKEKIFFFEGQNIWDICNLISNADCVIGTSLHVRIVASCFARPRITINLLELDGKKAPQYQKTCHFINEWDSIKNSAIKLTNLADEAKRMIRENKIDGQLAHNEWLKTIFFEGSNWINRLDISISGQEGI